MADRGIRQTQLLPHDWTHTDTHEWNVRVCACAWRSEWVKYMFERWWGGAGNKKHTHWPLLQTQALRVTNTHHISQILSTHAHTRTVPPASTLRLDCLIGDLIVNSHHTYTHTQAHENEACKRETVKNWSSGMKRTSVYVFQSTSDTTASTSLSSSTSYHFIPPLPL